MSRTRSVATVAAAVVAAVTLLGCRGSSDQPDAAAARRALTAAAEATRAAGSATVKFSFTTGADTSGASTFDGAGAFDFKNERGRLRFDLGKFVSGAPDDATLELRVFGPALYLHSPSFRDLGPEAKPWYRMHPGDLAGQSGSLSQFGRANPGQQLAYLDAVKDDVEVVGEESVRGLATTHYRATVDPGKLGSGGASASPGKDIPLDVWVDANNLTRRIRAQFSAAAELGAPEVVVTVEMHDFGVPVEVAAPAAHDVADIRVLTALVAKAAQRGPSPSPT